MTKGKALVTEGKTFMTKGKAQKMTLVSKGKASMRLECLGDQGALETEGKTSVDLPIKKNSALRAKYFQERS